MVFWGVGRVFGMGVKVGVIILLMAVGVLMDLFPLIAVNDLDSQPDQHNSDPKLQK